jgi:hypothetical protein
MLILDMIDVLPPMRKYRYDTCRILLMKCYIDNSVRLQSCIRNINNGLFGPLSLTVLLCHHRQCWRGRALLTAGRATRGRNWPMPLG